MRNIFLILIFLPFSMLGQKTFIPDDAFEQVLINLDLDGVFDDSVYTSAIDTVQQLYISNKEIVDLTGIEDFLALTDLFCHDNLLESLDLSNNPNLLCVEVDNVPFANYSWLIDNTAVFSTNCNPSSVSDVNSERRLIKIVDLSGRELRKPTNQPILYIYNDGTVEKKNILE